MLNERITGRKTVATSRTCSACFKDIPSGGIAWFCRQESITKRYRCVDCGAHPNAKAPRKLRKTKNEGLIMRPRDVAIDVESTETVAIALQPNVVNTLNARIDALSAEVNTLNARIATLVTPRVLEILAKGEVKIVTGAHAALEELVFLVECDFDNIYVVGPAGSGKTTLAAQLAKALGCKFGFLSLSGGTSESKLTGNLRPQADGSWAWHTTLFVDIFENGGVFLLDEMDGADPNVLVSINAALANGELEVDGRIVKRSTKCIVVGAANTFGTGADAIYVGRNPLDGATRDRFVGAIVEVNYDVRIEQAYAATAPQGDEFLKWVHVVRARASEKKVLRVIGTRMVQAGVKLLRGGATLEATKQRMLVGWSRDEVLKVQGS